MAGGVAGSFACAGKSTMASLKRDGDVGLAYIVILDRPSYSLHTFRFGRCLVYRGGVLRADEKLRWRRSKAPCTGRENHAAVRTPRSQHAHHRVSKVCEDNPRIRASSCSPRVEPRTPLSGRERMISCQCTRRRLALDMTPCQPISHASWRSISAPAHASCCTKV